MRRALLLVLMFACSPIYADMIRVVATGRLFDYTDPMGLLPFPQPPADSAMTLSFDYDSETADTVDDPNVGMYIGAISNLTLSIGDITLSALPENLIWIVNDSPADGNHDGIPDGVKDIWIATTFREESGLRTAITLPLFGAAIAIDSDALIGPSYLYPWGRPFIIYEIQDFSNPNSPQSLAEAYASADSLTVTTVPVPASGFLLISCLLAVSSRLRYRRTRR